MKVWEGYKATDDLPKLGSPMSTTQLDTKVFNPAKRFQAKAKFDVQGDILRLSSVRRQSFPPISTLNSTYKAEYTYSGRMSATPKGVLNPSTKHKGSFFHRTPKRERHPDPFVKISKEFVCRFRMGRFFHVKITERAPTSTYGLPGSVSVFETFLSSSCEE